MQIRKRSVHAFLALLVAAAAALPGSAANARTPAPTTVLTIATTGTVDSLNPFLAQRVLPTTIHRLTYDFLTNYDAADNRPVPAMATEWSTSADKLTWTFRIRSGMTWSDGAPVTARDIAWTYQLVLTNADAGTANGNFVANFSSVAAPDDTTLIITLKRPQATMLALDIPVVPEHIWRGHVADIGTFPNDTPLPLVGNGPFILTGYRPDQYIELSANKHHWRGPPKFDRLVVRMYKNVDAEVAALRKGEVDFVGGLTAAQFESLAGTAHVARNRSPGKGFYALNLNPGATTTSGEAFGDGSPALRDLRVRQSIRYAIDTRLLVDRSLGGYGQSGTGYLPPIFAANHWAPSPGQAFAYDPAAADRLLDSAGYRKQPDGLRTGPDGKRLTLRLTGMTQRVADAQNATYVVEWLKAVGITVVPSIVDEGALGEAVTSGNYDLAFDSWLTNPDPDYVLAIQTCPTRPAKPGSSFPGANFVCDPTYDALYAQQLAEYDAGKRATLIQAMQQRLYTEAYVNVLYYPDVLEAYRTDVIAGMTKQPQPNGMYSNQDGYWSWWSATPVLARRDGTGPPVAVTVLAAAAALTLAVGIVWFLRRRATAYARE